MRPYLKLMRFHKPIGIWLVFFPAAWGVLLAAPKPDGALLLLMLVGAALMRAAGCIANDIADRELDKKVERTRDRPLAAGTVPMLHAYILLGTLLFASLLIVLQLPRTVLLLSQLALPMIAAYPFMKRFTWWPQAFLGITFNLGALIGWAATGEPLELASFALYFACVCWTLGYDTIYAVQDMRDDAAQGMKSTALWAGANLKTFVTASYVGMLFFLVLTACIGDVSLLALCGLIFVTWHAKWQVEQLDAADGATAGMLFRSNQWLGLGFFVALLADRILL